MKADWWNRAGVVAEVVIAACAVFGFVYTIYQNAELREVIRLARESFQVQAYPLVKFKEYQWIVKTGQPSCENPPGGINASFRNASGVPLAVETSDLNLKIGERPILGGPPGRVPESVDFPWRASHRTG